MRVLVTGGAGFIGSNLVHAIVDRHDVGVIDDMSTGSPANLHPAAWYRTCDILDPGLPALVAEFGPEAVVHLAAQVSVAESLVDPARDRAVNVEGMRAVASAAAAAGARRFLSASSAAVYGEPDTVPIAETAPKRPQNPYGASKLEGESVLAQTLRAAGVDFASLRFSNVYGPRQDWRGEGGVVAIFAAAMTEDRAPTLFGDASQTRDFVYVGDVVSAMIAALGSDAVLAAAGPDGPAYNVSTGQETTIAELAGRIRTATRYTGDMERGPLPDGDIARSALDPSKAGATFGWRAGVALDVGVASTVRWFEQNA